MADVLPRRAEDPLLLPPQDLRIRVPAIRKRRLHRASVPSSRDTAGSCYRTCPHGTMRSARDGASLGRRAAAARGASAAGAAAGAGPAARLRLRRLPHRPPRRRRRAAGPEAPARPRPPDRRPDGGRAPARRPLARLDGRHVPLLPLRPREPLRVGALHGLRPRRRLRGVGRRRRALLPPASRTGTTTCRRRRSSAPG